MKITVFKRNGTNSTHGPFSSIFHSCVSLFFMSLQQIQLWSQVSGRWTLPSQSSSPLLSSAERLPMSQVTQVTQTELREIYWKDKTLEQAEVQDWHKPGFIFWHMFQFKSINRNMFGKDFGDNQLIPSICPVVTPLLLQVVALPAHKARATHQLTNREAMACGPSGPWEFTESGINDYWLYNAVR